MLSFKKKKIIPLLIYIFRGHVRAYMKGNEMLFEIIGERSERDTLRSVQLRIADIYITRKWFPLWGE